MSTISQKREEEIRELLSRSLEIHELRFEDFSSQHAGHNVQAKHGGSHVHLFVVSPGFAGLSRVQRSRAVHDALAPLLSSGKIHALTLKLVVPGEEN
jgi:BolA protein